MSIEVFIPDLEDDVLGHTRITEDKRFIYPSDEEITTGDLLSLVYYHREKLRPKYHTEYEYYCGNHPILKQPRKPIYKPDNRIIINFPKKAVTSFNGFFIGNPVKIDHKDPKTDKWIESWQNTVDFDDVSAEVSKMSSMYGHAYFFMYQDDELDEQERNRTLVAPLSPLNTFLIYDDSYSGRVKYGVTYRKNLNQELEITLFDQNYKRTFTDSAASNSYLNQVKSVFNPYPIVPIVEAPENEERIALCEDVFNLVDAQNKAISEKANDVDYFGDAYMKFINTYVDEDTMKKIKADRVINVRGSEAKNATVEFMGKPDADATQEHLIDRLVDNMYQMSNITNLNDDSFSGDVSGVALEMKFQAMSDMSKTKSLKFKRALRQVFRCVMAVNIDVQNSDYADLMFQFTMSIPRNHTEEATTFAQYYGKVPTKILYQQLSFIDDPEAAYRDMQQEKLEMAGQTANIMQQATQSPSVDQKGGVTDADAGTRATTNKSTNKAR